MSPKKNNQKPQRAPSGSAQPQKVSLSREQLFQLLQVENTRFQQAQERVNALRQILNETNSAKEAVQEIAKAKENEKIVIPLGSGVFAFAKIEDTKQGLVSLAGGAGKPKTFTEIEQDLEKRRENLQSALEKENDLAQRTFANLQNLSTVLQQAENNARRQRR